jgi:hypothetical protein
MIKTIGKEIFIDKELDAAWFRFSYLDLFWKTVVI